MSTHICEVSPMPHLLSHIRSFGDNPAMAKSPRCQPSSGSVQLLAKEASVGSEGDISPVSKVLEVRVLPRESEGDAMETEDAAVVVPLSNGDHNGEEANEDGNANYDDGKEVDEEGKIVGDEMEQEESGASMSDHDAVPSGSGAMDAPAGSVPYAGPAPIEIIISFDTTGSMSYYLDEVKAKIQEIIQRLFMDIPDMKIGVMAHGDYCDEKVFYLMQKVDFTNDVASLCQFVKDVEGTGGGDFEECYEWVLSEVRNLDWTPGTQRSLIMIGDAIPHEADYELNKQKLDWKAEADALFNERGVRVYAVQCQNEKGAANFWKDLAQRTHGRHLKLDQFSSIVDILMAICYREHSAEYFEAYEKEVRSRVGPHIVPEMDSAFDVLRGGPSTSKPKMTIDLSKGASKKKAIVKQSPAKRNVAKKAAKNPEPSSSAAVTRKARQPLKTLDVATKKGAKTVTKARHAKVVNNPKRTSMSKIARETVPCTKFILNGLRWSSWKLAMCDSAPDERDSWQDRRNGRPGVLNVDLFSRTSNKAAVYEFAVRLKKDSPRKKYVVYAKATSGFSDRLWDSALLGKDGAQEEIDSVISAGCELYVRRAYILGGLKVNDSMLKTPRQFSSVLSSRYDYAWRFVRRAGSSTHVCHRQVDIGAGVLASRASLRKCPCVMCS